MKTAEHKQELLKFWLLLIWFQCELHWWSCTHQNDDQSHSRHWTTFACQMMHKHLEHTILFMEILRFWGGEEILDTLLDNLPGRWIGTGETTV